MNENNFNDFNDFINYCLNCYKEKCNNSSSGNGTDSCNDNSSNNSYGNANEGYYCGDMPNGFQTINPQFFLIIGEIIGNVMAGSMPFNIQNLIGNWLQLVGQIIETYNAQQQYMQGGPGRYYDIRNLNVNNPFCSQSTTTTTTTSEEQSTNAAGRTSETSSTTTTTSTASQFKDSGQYVNRSKQKSKVNKGTTSRKGKISDDIDDIRSYVESLKDQIDSLKSEIEDLKNNR